MKVMNKILPICLKFCFLYPQFILMQFFILCHFKLSLCEFCSLAGTDVEQVGGENTVVLAPNNVFGIDIVVTNVGMDTSLGSVIDIVVPPQVEISSTVSEIML